MWFKKQVVYKNEIDLDDDEANLSIDDEDLDQTNR